MRGVPKTADDIWGREYDWLGSDASGCCALFSTAGAGYAPAEFLRDTGEHADAIEIVLALAASTKAAFAPRLRKGFVNTWLLVAERGLYAYDSNPNGGPYELVAAPIVPVRVDTLPARVAEVASLIRCASRFESQRIITDEMLRTRR